MITFNEAVKDAVAIYTSANKKFSAKDVVQDLRDGVNLGEIDLSDRPREDVDGKWTFKIDYTEVKNEIARLLSAGEIAGYRTSFDRGAAGVYRIYIPIQNATVKLPTGTNHFSGSGTQSTTIASLNGVVTHTNYTDVIKDYVTKNGPATAKRIQSRMKRTPITCSQIVDFAKNAGLPVNDNTSYASHAVIG